MWNMIINIFIKKLISPNYAQFEDATFVPRFTRLIGQISAPKKRTTCTKTYVPVLHKHLVLMFQLLTQVHVIGSKYS